MAGKQALARTAGVLYLVNVVTSIFSLASGSASANNIAAYATLYRLSFLSGLVANTSIILAALVLYALFNSIDSRMALALVVLNAVGSAISSFSGLFHIAALLLATVPSYTVGWSSQASQALIQLMLEMNRQGGLVAWVLWALWLLPMAYLVYRSGYFPKVFAVFLVLGCVGYLIADAGNYASPGFDWNLAIYFQLLGVSEILFALWLVIIGASNPKEGSR